MSNDSREAPFAEAVAELERDAQTLLDSCGSTTTNYRGQIAERMLKLAAALRSVPVPAPGVMVTDERVISGAAAIVDVWMGKDRTWRERLARGDGDFLESADWQNAMCLSRAVLSAALRPKE